METTQLIGVGLAMIAAGCSGWPLARAWSTPRLTPLRGALVGAVVAAPTHLLMQFLGGGGVGFAEGQIDWPPVVSTVALGLMCGVIAVGAVGIVRMGSRRPFG
ncbi:MAG: hypothetical protein AAGM38_16630 [Pseudomonadota bacterium]